MGDTKITRTETTSAANVSNTFVKEPPKDQAYLPWNTFKRRLSLEEKEVIAGLNCTINDNKEHDAEELLIELADDLARTHQRGTYYHAPDKHDALKYQERAQTLRSKKSSRLAENVQEKTQPSHNSDNHENENEDEIVSAKENSRESIHEADNDDGIPVLQHRPVENKKKNVPADESKKKPIRLKTAYFFNSYIVFTEIRLFLSRLEKSLQSFFVLLFAEESYWEKIGFGFFGKNILPWIFKVGGLFFALRLIVDIGVIIRSTLSNQYFVKQETKKTDPLTKSTEETILTPDPETQFVPMHRRFINSIKKRNRRSRMFHDIRWLTFNILSIVLAGPIGPLVVGLVGVFSDLFVDEVRKFYTDYKLYQRLKNKLRTEINELKNKKAKIENPQSVARYNHIKKITIRHGNRPKLAELHSNSFLIQQETVDSDTVTVHWRKGSIHHSIEINDPDLISKIKTQKIAKSKTMENSREHTDLFNQLFTSLNKEKNNQNEVHEIITCDKKPSFEHIGPHQLFIQRKSNNEFIAYSRKRENGKITHLAFKDEDLNICLQAGESLDETSKQFKPILSIIKRAKMGAVDHRLEELRSLKKEIKSTSQKRRWERARPLIASTLVVVGTILCSVAVLYPPLGLPLLIVGAITIFFGGSLINGLGKRLAGLILTGVSACYNKLKNIGKTKPKVEVENQVENQNLVHAGVEAIKKMGEVKSCREKVVLSKNSSTSSVSIASESKSEIKEQEKRISGVVMGSPISEKRPTSTTSSEITKQQKIDGALMETPTVKRRTSTIETDENLSLLMAAPKVSIPPLENETSNNDDPAYPPSGNSHYLRPAQSTPSIMTMGGSFNAAISSQKKIRLTQSQGITPTPETEQSGEEQKTESGNKIRHQN